MLRAILACMFLSASMQADNDARLLYEFASAGDRPQFSATLDRAKASIESMPLGAARNRLRRAIIVSTDLERVWQFEGLYWDEQLLPDYYDRLVSEYPGFDRYINAFRLIDRDGNVLYPKQETRDFLLKQLNRDGGPRSSAAAEDGGPPPSG